MGGEHSKHDERMGFPGGYISIKCDREYYYPGNKVIGKIYIRVNPNVVLPAKNLILRLKAYEKSKFSEFEGEHDQEYRYKAKNVFIDLKLNCIDFP